MLGGERVHDDVSVGSAARHVAAAAAGGAGSMGESCSCKVCTMSFLKRPKRPCRFRGSTSPTPTASVTCSCLLYVDCCLLIVASESGVEGSMDVGAKRCSWLANGWTTPDACACGVNVRSPRSSGEAGAPGGCPCCLAFVRVCVGGGMHAPAVLRTSNPRPTVRVVDERAGGSGGGVQVLAARCSCTCGTGPQE